MFEVNDGEMRLLKNIQNNNKIRNFIIVFIMLITLTSAVIWGMNAPQRALKKQLELGRRFLTELDYDQAIASFRKAIEIDPLGLDGYLGGADAYIGKGDLESAQVMLEGAIELFEKNGLDATALMEKLVYIRQELDKIKSEIIEHDYSNTDDISVVDEFSQITNDFDSSLEALYVALQNQEYMRAKVIYNEDCSKYYVNMTYIPNDSNDNYGVKIIYTPGGQYCVYYGELNNGICSGNGVLLKDLDWDNQYKIYTGTFENDMPNGTFECSTVEIYDDEYENEEHVNTIRGNLVDGLWDGQTFMKEDYTDSWGEGPSFNRGHIIFDAYTTINSMDTIGFRWLSGYSCTLGSGQTEENIEMGPYGSNYQSVF